MIYIWIYRFYLSLFLPFLIVNSTSFVYSVINSIYLLLIGSFTLCLYYSIIFMFHEGRKIFYLFFFSFFSCLYVFYQITFMGSIELFKLNFLEYFALLFPILPMILVLSQKNQIRQFQFKPYYILLSSISISLIIIGFIRELLSFSQFVFFKWGETYIVLPTKKFLENFNIHLSNQFFELPIGGILVVGIMVIVIFYKMKEKYDRT